MCLLCLCCPGLWSHRLGSFFEDLEGSPGLSDACTLQFDPTLFSAFVCQSQEAPGGFTPGATGQVSECVVPLWVLTDLVRCFFHCRNIVRLSLTLAVCTKKFCRWLRVRLAPRNPYYAILREGPAGRFADVFRSRFALVQAVCLQPRHGGFGPRLLGRRSPSLRCRS